MDLKQLRYFSAVVEQGSISAAARALFMSQPPLSTQVRQLEKELGVQLFSRDGHKLTLTPAGKLLYDRAQGLLDTAQSVEAELHAFGERGQRILRLGTVSSICSTDLPRWIAAFCRSRPDIRLELSEQNTYQLVEQLKARRLDLALIRTPFSPDGLEYRTVRQEKMMAVGEPRFFAGLEGRLTVAQLSRLPLIVYRRWVPPLGDLMRKEGITPAFFCVCDDARTVRSLALGGVGVGVLPGSAAGGPEAEGAVRMEIESESFRSSIVAAVCRDGYRPPETAGAVSDFIRCLPKGGEEEIKGDLDGENPV